MKLSTIHLGCRRGQAIILMVVSMGLFMMGAIGLAIDGAQIYAQQQMAQAAADAAASAGIMSILKGTNSTSTYTFGTGTPPLASSVCTTSDGRTPCVYARYNGFGATSSDTVTLSYPTTVTGVTLSSVTVPAFKVSVQRILNNGLIRFVGGPAHTTVIATATSGITGSTSPWCIIALDTSVSKAVSIPGGSTVTATGCGIAANSTNSDAYDEGGGAHVTASVIQATGGAQVGGGGTATPTPVTGKTAVADPYGSLAAYPIGPCTDFPTQYTPPNGTMLMPDTYCGGIQVPGGGTTVTFASGVYVMKGGGINFQGASTSSGTNVMFYLTGTNANYQSVTVGGSASVSFTAPTSGTYAGVLFFQDRSITSNQNASFQGSPMAFTGALYFPTTNIGYQAQGPTYPTYSMSLIADTLTLQSTLNIQSSSGSQAAGLVQ